MFVDKKMLQILIVLYDKAAVKNFFFHLFL